MVINLQDRNLVVSYLQIFLRDTFGVTLRKLTDLDDIVINSTYEITINDPIKVTGSYNTQTYLSLALYMAFNYPNEGYPYKWEKSPASTDAWLAYPYEPDRLKFTLEKIVDRNFDNLCKSEDTYNDEFYDNLSLEDKSRVMSYTELLRYFLDQDTMNTYVNDIEKVEESTIRDCLVNILVSNLNNLTLNAKIAQVPERVIAYVLDEVASSISEEDEIFRVQKLLYYPSVPREIAGKYDVPREFDGKSTMDLVKERQQSFIDKYTTGGVVSLPENFAGFRVTGYFDPWTELIVRSEEGDNG